MVIQNTLKKAVFCILFTLCVLFVSTVYAKLETLYASYKYTMGDNDTKNDARRICFIEAKRLLLEKAGVYIESNTVVSGFKLAKDETRAFAAALLKAEIVNEEIKYEGQNMVIYMTVKADIDTDSVINDVRKLSEDQVSAAKIKEQQRQIELLEEKIISIQEQLASPDINKGVNLRKERKESFEQWDELEKIKFEIKQKTILAANSIEIGMTPSEVEKVIGAPRAKEVNLGRPRYNYGNVWLIFEGNIVACIIKADEYSPGWDCSVYKSMYPRAIIK